MVGVIPVPLSASDCGLSDALSVKVKLALRAPFAPGVKVTLMVQELPAASVTAAAGTGVGLREVRRVRPSECDAADAERSRAAVGERHRLRGTGGAHVLVAKADTRRAQAHSRSRCCTRPAERYTLRAACRVIGECQISSARSQSAWRKGHADGARATRRKRIAAAGAGVGLREVRRVRSGECDAADAERKRMIIGERQGLCRAL